MVQPLSNPEGGKPLRPGTSAPVITHAFAVEKGYYGYIWKIYIEAEDPDGDMLRIASVVDQTGYAIIQPIGSISSLPIKNISKAISVEYLQFKNILYDRMDTNYSEGFGVRQGWK